jgi:hypothetical protein
MKTSIEPQIFLKAGLLIIISVVISACQAGSLAAATATPVPTTTPELTHTPTAAPTSTPRPTSTSKPTATLAPTPALLGETVSNGLIAITVLDVYRHDRIVTGGSYYFTAKPGYVILDIFVKVQNISSSPVEIPWKDFYILDDKGDGWYPGFAGAKFVKNTENITDAFSIPTDIEVNGNEVLTIDDTVFMRLIYLIADKPEQIVQFGVEDSPLIEFMFKK